MTKRPRIDIEDDIQKELKANETGRLDQKGNDKYMHTFIYHLFAVYMYKIFI